MRLNMVLNADDYRVNAKPIEILLRDKTEQERYEAIGPIAVAYGVPIIVVCCYVGELYGFSTRLLDFIDRLKVFYTVTDIKGVKHV